MLRQIAQLVREKFHPLYNLRKSKWFVYNLMPMFDRPMWCRLYGVNWPVRVRAARHLSYVLNSSMVEPGIASLFVAIHQVIRPKVFFDIGANVGFYSWLMLSLDDSTQVVLFEPDPDHVALIEETIKHAGLTLARLLPVAVSDTTGSAQFSVDKASGATGTLATDSTFSERLFGWKPESIVVETIALDQVRQLKQLPIPDIVKIDVEMCEDLVFRGAANLFAEAQPLIIFECSSSNRTKCLPLLDRLGYRILNADEPGADPACALNFLALPKKHQGQLDELLSRWKLERAVWGKK